MAKMRKNSTPKKNTYSGKITSNPANEIPIGGEIHFKPVNFLHSPTDSIEYLENWSILEGIMLSVAFTDGEKHFIEGTAVLIAPGIAITATHVIEHRKNAIETGSIAIGCFGLSDPVQFWRVSTITFAPNSDLTILGLTYASALPRENTFHQAVLSTRLPSLGEKLSIIGFRAKENHFEITDPKNHYHSGDIFLCNGSVTERYIEGRDKFLIPWPCLEVSCASWGGMSGGPVFDQNGHLIGLLSTSFSSEDNQGPSYISLLWPAMTCTFSGGWPIDFFESKESLIESKKNICTIIQPEALTIHRNPTTGVTTTNYKIWE
jgi:hypothetical protein